MYVRINFTTKYVAKYFVGVAAQIEVVTDEDKVVARETLKATDENSSRGSLYILTECLRRITPGSIALIEFVNFDKRDSYINTAICNVNRWAENDWRKADGEPLANLEEVIDFYEALNVLTVNLTDGRSMPLSVLITDPADIYKDVQSIRRPLARIAELSAKEDLKAITSCKGDVLNPTYAPARPA